MGPSENLVLLPRRRDQLLLLGVSSAFVALTFLEGVEEAPAALRWGTRVFFGACALVFALQLLPGVSHLRLTSEGFEIRSLFRSGFVRWGDVERFFVHHGPGAAFVGVRFSPPCESLRTGRRVAAALTGAEGALPDNYGRRVEDLAALMEEWRGRATIRASQPPATEASRRPSNE